MPEDNAFIRYRARLLGVLLAVATLTVYAQVLQHEFLNYDDPDYVTANRHVLKGLTREGAAWALTTTYATNWFPVTWLSHMLDCQLYGTNAGLHLLTNVLLHVANTLLLFGLLTRMTGAAYRSAFVAALFALHPLHVESVAWVSERKDVLSTLFWMLTLWAYVAFVARPRWHRYLLIVLLFGLGLMTKPMLVTLPFVLLLLDYWPLRRVAPASALLVDKLPLFALAVMSSVMTLIVQRQESLTSLDELSLPRRAAHALISYVTYVEKTAWPVDLAVFYPYPHAPPLWQILTAGAALLAISMLAIRASRTHPYLAVGWLWYLGTLVPVIGIVQAGLQSIADRYTYVPLMGIFLMVAWGVPELLEGVAHRTTVLALSAGFVIVACATTTSLQIRHWRDSGTLFEHALAATTDNFVAHNNLGQELMRQGRVEEAATHFTESLRLQPEFPNAHTNLGGALFSEGRIDEAIVHYADALRLNPDDADTHYNLGVALYRQGKLDEAVQHFTTALRLEPDNATGHNNLGAALSRQGKTAEAIAEYAEAVRLDPDYEKARQNLTAARAEQRTKTAP